MQTPGIHSEDNQADVYLVEMALQEHGLRFTLLSAFDGDEAVRQMETFTESHRPDIALRDQTSLALPVNRYWQSSAPTSIARPFQLSS